jgi:hypothetical protein
VLLADLIMLVKENNSLFKISKYLQITFDAETQLAEGLTFARRRTSGVEKPLTDPGGTRKLTVPKLMCD